MLVLFNGLSHCYANVLLSNTFLVYIEVALTLSVLFPERFMFVIKHFLGITCMVVASAGDWILLLDIVDPS